MSHMEARAEMSWDNNYQSPIPQAQRVADRVHLRLAFLPEWDSNLQKTPKTSNDALTNSIEPAWEAREKFLLLRRNIYPCKDSKDSSRGFGMQISC